MARRRRNRSAFSLFSFQDVITSVSGIMILVALLLAVQLVARAPGSTEPSPQADVEQLEQLIASSQEEAERLRAQIALGGEAVAELAGVTRQQLQRESIEMARRMTELDGELIELADVEQRAAKAATEARAGEFDRREEMKHLDSLRESIAKEQAELEKLRSSGRRIYNPTSRVGQSTWLVQIDGEQIMAAKVGAAQPPLIFQQSTAAGRQRAFQDWSTELGPSSTFFFIYINPGGAEDFDLLKDWLQTAKFSFGFDLLGREETAIDPQTGAAME